VYAAMPSRLHSAHAFPMYILHAATCALPRANTYIHGAFSFSVFAGGRRTYGTNRHGDAADVCTAWRGA